MPKLEYVERRDLFWSQVEKTDYCWWWHGKKQTNGYGTFRTLAIPGHLAHRAAWFYANSEPIPEGMILMHSCDNRACVRPSHLVLGDHDENMRAMVIRERSASGTKHGSYTHPEAYGRKDDHPMAKLDSEKVRAIKKRMADGDVQARIADDFGVSKSLITWIKQGAIWADIS